MISAANRGTLDSGLDHSARMSAPEHLATYLHALEHPLRTSFYYKSFICKINLGQGQILGRDQILDQGQILGKGQILHQGRISGQGRILYQGQILGQGQCLCVCVCGCIWLPPDGQCLCVWLHLVSLLAPLPD